MSWLHTIAVVFHVLIGLAIVGLILLQRGRGADAGAGFGAGASGTVFGARGAASFLSRSTATLAALFFVTSLTLAYLGGRPAGPTSVVDRVLQNEPPPAPAAPSTDTAVPEPPATEVPAAPTDPGASADPAPQPQP